MTDVSQELMTPQETARWFRRSPSWLRQQTGLLRLAGPGGQPLYHVHVCRAYVLGRLCGLLADKLHDVQIRALAAACGLSALAAGEVSHGVNPDNPSDTSGLSHEV